MVLNKVLIMSLALWTQLVAGFNSLLTPASYVILDKRFTLTEA